MNSAVYHYLTRLQFDYADSTKCCWISMCHRHKRNRHMQHDFERSQDLTHSSVGNHGHDLLQQLSDFQLANHWLTGWSDRNFVPCSHALCHLLSWGKCQCSTNGRSSNSTQLTFILPFTFTIDHVNDRTCIISRWVEFVRKIWDLAGWYATHFASNLAINLFKIFLSHWSTDHGLRTSWIVTLTRKINTNVDDFSSFSYTFSRTIWYNATNRSFGERSLYIEKSHCISARHFPLSSFVARYRHESDDVIWRGKYSGETERGFGWIAFIVRDR